MNKSIEVSNNLEAFLTVNFTMNCTESEEQCTGYKVDTDADRTRELRHKKSYHFSELLFIAIFSMV